MDATVTLTDIARLAGVQRPVVSMWRQRATVRGHALQFPEPVARVGGVDRFDLTEVTRYLTDSGRGNNLDAALDGPALAPPAEHSLEDLVTLLCLRHLVGDDLDGRNTGMLGREVDSSDQFLASEVTGLVGPPSDYIDGLYAASLGPTDALDRLLQTSVGRNERRDELTASALVLVEPLIAELMVHLGEDAHVVDASAGASTMPLQIAVATGRPLAIDGDSADGRSARRVAILRGAALDSGISRRVLRVAGLTGMSPQDAVDRVGSLVMDLTEEDLGFVLGPASLLTDRIADRRVQSERDALLRRGYVRAAVRLPRGLLRRAPRQAQALWLVSSVVDTDSPVALGDLGDKSATEIVARDLAMDVVAVVARQRGHHFRYLVPRRLDAAVAAPVLVPRGLRAIQQSRASHSTSANDLIDLTARVNEQAPRLRVVETTSTPPSAAIVSVAQLKARGELRLHRGSRLDLAWADPVGTVEAAAVEGWAGVRFDPIDLQAAAPHVGRTEPGDVVFTVNPPRAFVDDRGGLVVPTPGRWMRLSDTCPVGPHALAAQINCLPESAPDVEAWTFALVGDSELDARLADLSALRRDLEGRLEGVLEIARLMATGESAGLSITTRPDQQEH